MNRKNDPVRETVINVITAISGLLLIELIVALFFIGGSFGVWSRLKITVLLGLLGGSVIGMGMFLHIKKSLEESLAFGEKSAPSHIRKSYAFRMLVVGGLLVLAAWSGWFDVLALLLGIMNLKIAVYLQPILHKIFRRKEDMK